MVFLGREIWERLIVTDIYISQEEKKELIITGGVNVYPQDIENKLIKLEGIEECAAFPYADERLGEVVALAIVVKGNGVDEKTDTDILCKKYG